MLQKLAADIEFRLLAGGVPKRRLLTALFFGAEDQYELAKEAIELLAQYSPGASNRVGRQIDRIVAVDLATEFRSALKTLYLNFEHFGSPFGVAFVLLLQASMALVRNRKRRSPRRGGDSSIRTGMRSSRRFLEWWTSRDSVAREERDALLAWAERLVSEGERRTRWDRSRGILVEIAAVFGKGSNGKA